MVDLVTIDETNKVIRVSISGNYQKEKFLTAVDTVVEYISENPEYKGIVDGASTTDGNIPALERFQLGEYMAIKLIGIRMAILWPKAHVKNFGTQVAVNRGAQVRSFYSEEEALNWLFNPA